MKQIEEWCEKYQGMTRDEFMNDISDMALEILEEKFKRSYPLAQEVNHEI